MDPNDEAELELELSRALALSAPAVPPEIDARILAAAADSAARRRSGRRRLVTAGWASALAVAATIAFLVTRPTPRYQARDVNADGKVDVLDAHRLARAIEAGETQQAWDFNGDGRVDAADVASTARAAVALGAGT